MDYRTFNNLKLPRGFLEKDVVGLKDPHEAMRVHLKLIWSGVDCNILGNKVVLTKKGCEGLEKARKFHRLLKNERA